MGYPLFTGNSTIESFFTLFTVLIFLIIFYLIKMFKSNVEVDQTVLQPMASAGGSVKKVIHPKVSVVKEEAAVSKELSTEPAFTLPSAEALGRGPSDSKIID